jgi:carboxymethylenebutenolidase
MDQKIIDLHHDYIHHHCDRRKFLEQASRVVGSTAAAAALLPVLDNNYALAQTVAENDPRVTTERVTFPGPGGQGQVMGYVAKPRAAGRYPAVVVVHEAGGLNPHTMDVARRLAAEGFVALAVDFLSPMGGTEAVNAARQAAAAAGGGRGGGGGGNPINQLTAEQNVQNGMAAIRYVRTRADVTGKVGVVGFCWGGRVTQNISVNDPSVNAVVVFYGQPPHPTLAPKLNAPILMNYADVMFDMNNTGEAVLYAQELKRLGKAHEFHIYPGAQHGFNNNTNTERHNAQAAELAWGRTIAWFKRHLA